MPLQNYRLLSFLLLAAVPAAHAQETDTLPNLTIRAFEQNRRLDDVPAALGLVSRATLNRFAPVSIVQAVNTIPGVRMEERSPGSYRINIRGSALRSPFGVRNVKVYFNDLPFTDPGGHTYLNQLGYYNFNTLEIIKGPGSSLYGAGTGGVMLIESLGRNEAPGVFAEYAGGSYGLHNAYVSATIGTDAALNRVGFQHQQSEGYRKQSALRRDVLSWSGRYQVGEQQTLRTTFLYSDLFYETPGALTEAEYRNNPRGARPGGFGFPGAEEARASIRQRSVLTGASYEQRWSPAWKNRTTLYGMFTDLRNPTVRNYGKSSEPHFGGRSQFTFERLFNPVNLQWVTGFEYQEGLTSVSIHKNLGGNPDSLQSRDEINNRLGFLFTQLTLDLGPHWQVLAGASLNRLRVAFQRFQPGTAGRRTRTFENELAPRLVLSYKILKPQNSLTLYSGLARGFSPPTTAELLPTGGSINFELDPEEGINTDLGIKGRFFNRLSVDVNAFRFALENTIVQRRDAGGGDFFANAGKTRQYGIESGLTYSLFPRSANYRGSQLWMSHTWHRFRYRSFRQLNADYSGKALPGIAPHSVAAGLDLEAQNGFLGSINYLYSDRAPLNDANTAYAASFHVLGLKAGYQKRAGDTWRLKFVAGIDNLLDQRYSLGNDINGFGGRYFNAAAGRTYYLAILGQWFAKRK